MSTQHKACYMETFNLSNEDRFAVNSVYSSFLPELVKENSFNYGQISRPSDSDLDSLEKQLEIAVAISRSSQKKLENSDKNTRMMNFLAKFGH